LARQFTNGDQPLPVHIVLTIHADGWQDPTSELLASGPFGVPRCQSVDTANGRYAWFLDALGEQLQQAAVQLRSRGGDKLRSVQMEGSSVGVCQYPARFPHN
jgi:hypothetical protein